MGTRYETVCIVRPDAGDDLIKAVIKKATATIEGGGGRLLKLDEWGRRRLAYTIRKRHEGYYFVMDYESSPEASKEIERQMRLNEDVLRYQTVRVTLPPAAPEQAASTAETPKQAAVAEGGTHGEA
jgi:small subunit ribosomal protein S6